jgi:hypothetical protein
MRVGLNGIVVCPVDLESDGDHAKRTEGSDTMNPMSDTNERVMSSDEE